MVVTAVSTDVPSDSVPASVVASTWVTAEESVSAAESPAA
jgi:hypothetical protein